MVTGYKTKPPIVSSSILPDTAFFIGNVGELDLPALMDPLELGMRELPEYVNALTFGDIIQRIGQVPIYDMQGARSVLRFVPRTFMNMNSNIVTHNIVNAYLDAVAAILHGQDREVSTAGVKTTCIQDVDYHGRAAHHNRVRVIEIGTSTAVGTYTITSANLNYWDQVNISLVGNALGTNLAVNVKPKGAAVYRTIARIVSNDANNSKNLVVPLGFYASFDLQYVVAGNAAVSVDISAFGA